MFLTFENFTYLQYRVKALEAENASLKSGRMYQKMTQGQHRQRNYYEREIRRLKEELEREHLRYKKMMSDWFEVYEDIQKDCRKKSEKQDADYEKLWAVIRRQDEEIRELRKQVTEKTRELVSEREKRLTEEEKNKNLKSELHEGFLNSSIPSSKTSFRPPVTNNREKSDKKPGAQPGHEGHKRKKHPITGDTIEIKAPEEILKDPDWYEQTGPNSEIHKQRVRIVLLILTDDIWTKVYRSHRTGARYHAPFPANMQNEMNYDESVKAIIFIMRNHLNVSEEKIQEFLSDLTDGEIKPSRGMINGINEEFAARTKEEQEQIFATLAEGPVMYTDMTGMRMNGKLKNVVVCTNGAETGYYFRDTKGDAAIAGTPLEDYDGTAVHDHDKTIYHYGTTHQECEEHHLRYLKGAMEMEPDLTWHKDMYSLLGEMNETRNRQSRILEESQISDFEKRYDEIVSRAEKEYYDNPPSRYYRKGYNLYKEFRDYKESNLFFLRHPEVDFTNNVSERALRKIGRHEAVSGTLRGNDNGSGEAYCAAMSVMQTDRLKGGSMYASVKAKFGRRKPRKNKRLATSNP